MSACIHLLFSVFGSRFGSASVAAQKLGRCKQRKGVRALILTSGRRARQRELLLPNKYSSYYGEKPCPEPRGIVASGRAA